MQQPMPNPKDITDPITAMNMTLVLMAKAFKLNYSTPTKNNQRISSNPRNNQNGDNAVQNNPNGNGNGNVVAAWVEGNAIRNNVDLDEIEEVNANCILMANLQQEQYTELLEPILEPHQVHQNDSNVISEVSSVEQSGGTVDQHPATVVETRAYFESLYNNLAIEVEKISKEKSTVSSLLEENKKLKTDSKIREDDLLDKQIQLENKIKELDNIMVKMGQSIQTMHTLSPKPDSFYLTEQKMALGYQNPFYLKQAQQTPQSLYDGKTLLEKHDPPAVYD
ncbi:hypothetical protein Tco_1003603 [Tanacetum coccineum]|uniref:Gag-Pol polyprotein n=1 Tax=Tanacetum coccineum TaxID=301880 RepID=A0ABQ5F9T1_9ASTR